MPLAEKWLFFFCTAFKPAHLKLKSMVHDVRGWFLISTSTLATWAAFPAFKNLISCCSWWVSAAESLDGSSLEGLYCCRKYFKHNIDIVEWFSQVFEQV